MDRFDICAACYVFAVLWHGGQFTTVYAYLGRLEKAGFKPSHSLQSCKLENENQRAIYRSLCLKHGV
jgi:hypothetical protein